MKKTFLTFFLIIPLFCFSQVLKDTLNGKVKFIHDNIIFHTKKHQIPKFLEYDGDYGHATIKRPKSLWKRAKVIWKNSKRIGYYNCKKTYTKNGYPLKEIFYSKKGELVVGFIYKYDKKNNLIQLKDYTFKDIYTVINYTYNHKNKPSTYLLYNTDDPNFYVYDLLFYDEKDNLIKIKSFDENGRIWGRIYNYDSKNRKTKVISHSPFAEKEFLKNVLRREYFYNSDDKIIKEIQYLEDYSSSDSIKPKIYGIIQKKYNNNLLSKETHLDSNNKIRSIENISYDKNKRISKIEITYPNIKKDKWAIQYFYDDTGNIIKSILLDENITYNIDFKYTFDKHNNWTRQTKSVNGEKRYTWKRKIKYYN